ncbi:MAG: DUF4157 domain-containing protein [Pseudomonadota bacterium]
MHDPWAVASLQDTVGNARIQEMIASERSPREGFERATSEGSRPIPFKTEMEASFSEDFSDVGAFMGQDAPLAGMGARAAAQGEDVAFASTSPDRETVAHELTHVVQSRRGGGQMASQVSGPSDASEVEAERAAADVMAGETPVIEEDGGGIQRGLLDAVGDALDLRENEAELDAQEDAAAALETFLGRTFAPLVDYRPSSGYGMFDAQYDPRWGTLTITLKVGFQFIQGNAANTLAGFHPEEYQWAPGEDATWSARFLTDMTAAWTGANFLLRCNRQYWSALQAAVRINVVRDDADPHFTVIVEKYPQNADSIRSSVCEPGYHHDPTRTQCDGNTAPAGGGSAPNSGTTVLSSNDLDPEHMLDRFAAVTSIQFDRGSDAVPPGEQGKIQAVLAQLQADPAAHVRLKGFSSSDRRGGTTVAQGEEENMDLARRRTGAVEQLLVSAGIAPARIMVRDYGQSSSTTSLTDCRVDLQVGNQAVFNTAMHETGHMLGLGDEYVDTGRVAGAPVEAGYRGMVTAQTGDNVVAADDDSVMSMGSQVRSWHVSPFLEVQRQITGMTEWGV